MNIDIGEGIRTDNNVVASIAIETTDSVWQVLELWLSRGGSIHSRINNSPKSVLLKIDFQSHALHACTSAASVCKY